VFKTPGLRYFDHLCVTFPLILRIKLNGALQTKVSEWLVQNE